MTRPASARKWSGLALMYFGAVAFGLAQPVYAVTLASAGITGFGRLDALLLVATVQVVPVAVLLAARFLARSLGPVVDAAVFLGALLCVLRQAELRYLPEGRIESAGRVAILAGLAVIVLVVAWGARRHLRLYLTYLGLLSLLLPLHFLRAYLSEARPAPVSEGRTLARKPDRSVFVFIFDSVSLEALLDGQGRIDPRLFPNLSRFSRESVWLRQAIANYPVTALSVRSLLAGTLIPGVEVPAGSDISRLAEPNLLSGLRAGGYTVAFYSRYFRCRPGPLECVRYYAGSWPRKMGRLAAETAVVYLPGKVTYELFPALGAFPDLVEGRMLAELGTEGFGEPGHASVFHFMLTHVPYLLGASGRPAATRDYVVRGGSPGVSPVHYRQQIRYLDRQFGAFLDGLRKSGAWETSVVVVAADHGECWAGGCAGRDLPLSSVAPSLARIPLMLRVPGMAPRVLDSDVQLVDLYPTLADVLRLRPASTAPAAGRSALAPAAVPRRRPFFVGTPDRFVDIGLPARRVEVAHPAGSSRAGGDRAAVE